MNMQWLSFFSLHSQPVFLFSAPSQDAEPDLCAWWKCDGDSSAILKDSGPLGLDAHLSSPILRSSDDIGACLTFPAQSNSVIEIPFNDGMQSRTGDFSVSFWYALPMARPGTMRLIDAPCTPSGWWHVSIADGRPNMDISFIPEGEETPIALDVRSWTELPEGRWCHVTMCVDCRALKVTIYLDGLYEGEYTIDPKLPRNFWPESPDLGNDRTASMHPAGLLADLKLYRRALTYAEIKSDYQSHPRKGMVLDKGPVVARISPVFSDHMVLQRDMRVPVYGTAPDGSEVTVAFAGQTRTTHAEKGRWLVKFPPMKASSTGQSMEVSIKDSQRLQTVVTTLEDVLVGDVWMASGQSNMQMSLAEAEKELPAGASPAGADLPEVRFFQVDLSTQIHNLFRNKWEVCTRQSSAGYSAVAYYFARDFNRDTKIPVGIIGNHWGGSRIDTWMNPDTFDPNNPAFAEIAKAYIEGRTFGSHRFEMPGVLFQAVIRPWIPYAIRGVLWYQGESNAGDAPGYRILLKSMIADWRKQWGEGNFPFYIIQIPKFQYLGPEIRDAQWAVAREVPNAHLVVAIDTGSVENIHPCDKEPIGERLALLARADVLGEHIEWSGPMYKGMQIKGNEILLSFDHASGGLKALGVDLPEFEICGEDKVFKPASARIVGDQVVVNSPEVPQPCAARYAWKPLPEKSLGNSEGLPAGPFSTDTYAC